MSDETDNKLDKILIVENDRTLLVALRDYLATRGYKILVAVSGEEGLKIFRQEQPDLIVLDLMLGQMTGVDVLRSIRQDENWGQQVKIIVLTGLTYLTNLEEVKKLATKFISKSNFEMESLANVIKQLLT